jgi:hypothetical protein
MNRTKIAINPYMFLKESYAQQFHKYQQNDNLPLALNN